MWTRESLEKVNLFDFVLKIDCVKWKHKSCDNFAGSRMVGLSCRFLSDSVWIVKLKFEELHEELCIRSKCCRHRLLICCDTNICINYKNEQKENLIVWLKTVLIARCVGGQETAAQKRVRNSFQSECTNLFSDNSKAFTPWAHIHSTVSLCARSLSLSGFVLYDVMQQYFNCFMGLKVFPVLFFPYLYDILPQENFSWHHSCGGYQQTIILFLRAVSC